MMYTLEEDSDQEGVVFDACVAIDEQGMVTMDPHCPIIAINLRLTFDEKTMQLTGAEVI